ncbi:MAG: hypothetical protein V4501_02800 [Pseudomonadota bacterium]
MSAPRSSTYTYTPKISTSNPDDAKAQQLYQQLQQSAPTSQHPNIISQPSMVVTSSSNAAISTLLANAQRNSSAQPTPVTGLYPEYQNPNLPAAKITITVTAKPPEPLQKMTYTGSVNLTGNKSSEQAWNRLHEGRLRPEDNKSKDVNVSHGVDIVSNTMRL